MREEVVKSPDWIQELYLKEMVHKKSTKGEKTHDKHGKDESKIEADSRRNKELPGKLQPQKSVY